MRSLRSVGYDRELALMLCNASATAYLSAAWLSDVQNDWSPDAVRLIRSNGTQALCMSDTKAVIVAVRGTRTLSDHLRNMTARRAMFTPAGESRAVAVHEGFLSSFEAIAGELADWLSEQSPGARPLYMTGHSAGGAIAHIAAVDTAGRGPKPTLYTFGSPRVGGREFCRLSRRALPDRHQRVTHSNDAVPLVPLLFRTGWILPRWLPVFPTLRRLAHAGSKTRLREPGGGWWSEIPFDPISDHSIERYQEALEYA